MRRVDDRGMTPRLPPLLSGNDLPLPELQAARLDGELFSIGDAFIPVDEVEGPRHRARAVHSGLPARVIAEQRSAAWIWGALEAPPRPHQVCVDIAARVRLLGVTAVAVREVVIDAADIELVDGLSVTTPLRTVIDLARFSPRFGHADESIVRALMSLGGFGLEECLTDLDRRRNLPNKRQAVDRLARL